MTACKPCRAPSALQTLPRGVRGEVAQLGGPRAFLALAAAFQRYEHMPALERRQTVAAAIREAQALQQPAQLGMPSYHGAAASSGSGQEGVQGTPGQGSRAAPPQGAITRMMPLRQPANTDPEVSALDGDGLTGSSRRRNGWQGGLSSLQDTVRLQAEYNSHSRRAPPTGLPLDAPSSPDQHVPADAAPGARIRLDIIAPQEHQADDARCISARVSSDKRV